MSEYIELFKKCGAKIYYGAVVTRSGMGKLDGTSFENLYYGITEAQLTAYSEALRAKDKEEIERLKNVLFKEKEHRTAQRLGYKTELAATQYVLEQMRELFDAILNPNDHLNVWSIYSPRMSDEAIYKSIAHYAVALQVSTDALLEHDAKALEDVAEFISRNLYDNKQYAEELLKQAAKLRATKKGN
ncbi:MAG: hypothetical protein KGI08_09340 [Thaumarchaeota archaeon]|nr:hypothetical protein [Nitrososphaerota archaeon]